MNLTFILYFTSIENKRKICLAILLRFCIFTWCLEPWEEAVAKKIYHGNIWMITLQKFGYEYPQNFNDLPLLTLTQRLV